MVVISCNDDNNPTGPSINKADLVGTWSFTKYVYTAKGQPPESENVNDVEIFKYTEDNKAISYHNFETCTEIDTALNVLKGDKISGAEGDLKISIQGDEMIMTVQNANGSTEAKYYTKYTGVVPPASWPATECSGTLSKKNIKKN
jgi:hypothetical protein